MKRYSWQLMQCYYQRKHIYGKTEVYSNARCSPICETEKIEGVDNSLITDIGYLKQGVENKVENVVDRSG